MASKTKKKQRSESRHAARQERKKATAAANPPAQPGGELLCHPERFSSDSKLLAVAVSEDWPVMPDQKQKLVERLAGIIEKTTVQIPCGEGVFDSEATADANAIKAGALMKSMADANVRKNNPTKQQPQTTINVGVNVDNRTDERRNLTLAIAERVRAGRVLQHSDGAGD